MKAGDKLYAVCMNKTIALFHMGTKPLTEGMNILGAHIDSPRIDVKQNPLYENEEFAYLDTHYYGGIKKYQWVTLPLAMHGVIAKKDGSVVTINIGEKPEDPVRTGYRFAGWYEDEELTTPYTIPAKMPNKERMVYAKWEAEDVGYQVVEYLEGTNGVYEAQDPISYSGPVSYTHLTLPTT